MSSLNKAQIIGRLGVDPEVNTTGSGLKVATLSVATSERWTDKAAGEKREETEWHRVTLWRRQAEIAEEYLHKGDLVYIEGPIKTEKWQDRDGNDRYTTKIIGQRLQMLGSPRGDRQGGGDRPRQERRQPPGESRTYTDANGNVYQMVPGGKRPDAATQAAADKLGATAEPVREKDPNDDLPF